MMQNLFMKTLFEGYDETEMEAEEKECTKSRLKKKITRKEKEMTKLKVRYPNITLFHFLLRRSIKMKLGVITPKKDYFDAKYV